MARISRSILSLALLGALAPAALATTVNVDLGGDALYTGAGPAGGTGTVWNDGPGSNLVDSQGLATTISAAVSTGNTYQTITQDNDHEYTALATNLLSDYSYVSGTSGFTLTLSGLQPGGAYTLYDIGPGAAYDGYANKATVAAVTYEVTNSPTNQASWISGNNYIAIPFTADVDGNFVFTFTPNTIGADETDLAGFQIVSADVVVPEPASLGVVALGALGLIARRRR